MLIKLACGELLLEGCGLFHHIYYVTVLCFVPEFFAVFLAKEDGTEIHGRY